MCDIRLKMNRKLKVPFLKCIFFFIFLIHVRFRCDDREMKLKSELLQLNCVAVELCCTFIFNLIYLSEENKDNDINLLYIKLIV